ncbi:MAG: FkbM family methyltransferase [Thermaerobacter sp.]|nr:FkbM family methyltransferase [Thermaerobacter sp.]
MPLSKWMHDVQYIHDRPNQMRYALFTLQRKLQLSTHDHDIELTFRPRRGARFHTQSKLSEVASDVGIYRQVVRDYFQSGSPFEFPMNRRPVVVDAGANIGMFTLCVKSCFPAAEVHAFEPVPYVFAKARRNRDFNAFDRIHLNPVGLSRKPGTVHLTVVAHGTQGTIAPDLVRSDPVDKIGVPSTTLDLYTSAHDVGEIDLLKIDVEGAELDVLEGSANTLARTRNIVMEYHSPALHERTLNILHDFGFGVESDHPHNPRNGIVYLHRSG